MRGKKRRIVLIFGDFFRKALPRFASTHRKRFLNLSSSTGRRSVRLVCSTRCLRLADPSFPSVRWKCVPHQFFVRASVRPSVSSTQGGQIEIDGSTRFDRWAHGATIKQRPQSQRDTVGHDAAAVVTRLVIVVTLSSETPKQRHHEGRCQKEARVCPSVGRSYCSLPCLASEWPASICFIDGQ